uniref:Uncharacterized protein n=1 Tax=Rhizophora mucronata TaxID=61149 RepID=A0A2P2MRV3_RHIMU
MHFFCLHEKKNSEIRRSLQTDP